MEISSTLKLMELDNWTKFSEIYKSNVPDDIKKQIFKDSCREFFLFGDEVFKTQVEGKINVHN